MTKKNGESQDVGLDPVTRPEISELAEPLKEYLLWLEERCSLLETELEAAPGAEARGIFWIDLFGTVPHPYNPEIKLKIKGNLTQRSDVDSLQAARLAINSVKAIRGEFNMYPWQPQATPTNGKQQPQQTQQTPDPVGEPEEQPAGRQRSKRQSKRSDPQPSRTKTEEPIGDEKWYKVKSLILSWNQDHDNKLVLVKCGKWHKHGVVAYLDSSNMPEDVVTSIESGAWSTDDMPIEGKELSEDFSDMQFALIAKDDKKVKVVGFSNHMPE